MSSQAGERSFLTHNYGQRIHFSFIQEFLNPQKNMWKTYNLFGGRELKFQKNFKKDVQSRQKIGPWCKWYQ